MRLAILAASLFAAACHEAASAPPDLGPIPTPAGPTAAATTEGAPLNPRLMRRFRSLTPPPPEAAAKIELGRMLFYDQRLSQDGDLSCNSCHQLDEYGVDHLATSVGNHRQRGQRNAPSVYHAAGQVAVYWDGRSPDLVDQAGQPITNPVEMAMTDAGEVVAVLRGVAGYRPAFEAAFPGDPEPITFAHVTEAIAAFERGLQTPARWDRYLDGDHSALTADEVEGFRIFADIGCVECHTGAKLGGAMFQKAGRMNPWPDGEDPGRYRVTGLEADRMVFKVPSLRNVAHTAPYFHDGSVATLDRAVRMMAHHQLDLELDDREVRLIVAWLDSLTGELPAGYIAKPALP